MRRRWKIGTGTSIAGICATAILVSHAGYSREVSGDDSSSTQPPPTTASASAFDPMPRDPFAPYPTPVPRASNMAFRELTFA